MTHASVFSGIGGPEIAATMLGWDNVFHCEINPQHVAELRKDVAVGVAYNFITEQLERRAR